MVFLQVLGITAFFILLTLAVMGFSYAVVRFANYLEVRSMSASIKDIANRSKEIR